MQIILPVQNLCIKCKIRQDQDFILHHTMRICNDKNIIASSGISHNLWYIFIHTHAHTHIQTPHTNSDIYTHTRRKVQDFIQKLKMQEMCSGLNVGLSHLLKRALSKGLQGVRPYNILFMMYPSRCVFSLQSA